MIFDDFELLIFVTVIVLFIIYLFRHDIADICFSYRSIREENMQKIITSIQSPLVSDPKIRALRTQIDSDIVQIIHERITNIKLRKIALISVDGGKRIRPIIAYSIIRKMNPKITDQRLSTVNAVEILHSASLMIDDMMDEDDMRRGKISPHVLYGRDMTLLSATQMVMCAFMMIGEIDMQYISDVLCRDPKKIKNYKMIINSVLQKTTKLIDGQTIDLENDVEADKNMILDVLNKKTASIFEMIFMMSWVLGSGDPEKLKDVEKSAEDFGIMFQIYDDFTDIFKDSQKGFNLNYVLRFGFDEALSEFLRRKRLFTKRISTLGIMTHEIRVVMEYLTDVVLKISKEFRHIEGTITIKSN